MTVLDKSGLTDKAPEKSLTKGLRSTGGRKQGIENVVLTDKAQKLMIDGALYIIRNNKLYNVQGAVVK